MIASNRDKFMVNDVSESAATPSGHQIDANDFLRDVAQLIAYISAGSDIARIWRKTEPDPDKQLIRFKSFFEEHQTSQIPKLLVSVAATLRSKVDDGSWGISDVMVGWLTHGEKIDPERAEVLSVREACNKIIHAKKVHPKYSKSDEGAQFIGAMITISGERDGKPWTAELNLLQFCIALANCTF